MKRPTLVAAAVMSLMTGCTSAQQGAQTVPSGLFPPSKTASGRAHSNSLHTAQASENVIYSFTGSPDASNPAYGDLVYANGMLYGTTQRGGTSNNGTAFSITTAGVESVIYSFEGSPQDGADPIASLDKSARYGTTYLGGQYGYGTVYKLTSSGREKVLHSFAGGATDGAYPYAGLKNVNGTLYGTTFYGGSGACVIGSNTGCGTVFSITPSGTYQVLYSFAGQPDGGYPSSGLINVNGTLYGTTTGGGSGGCAIASNAGCGTVFSITTSGTENVLYSFAGTPDGRNAQSGLINVNGVLYGTTVSGGASNKGTVFSITTSGTENVLYSFSGMPDGAYPQSCLVKMNRTLYGTTLEGGAVNEGTVFSITKSGTENVLYSFGGDPDGASPFAGLVNVNGVLYGTTSTGGSSNEGAVYSIMP